MITNLVSVADIHVRYRICVHRVILQGSAAIGLVYNNIKRKRSNY